MRCNQTLFDQTTPEGILQTLLQLRSTRHQSYLEQYVHDEKGFRLLTDVRAVAWIKSTSLSFCDDAMTIKKFREISDAVDAAWNCAMGNKCRRDYPGRLQNLKEDTVKDCMARRAGIR